MHRYCTKFTKHKRWEKRKEKVTHNPTIWRHLSLIVLKICENLSIFSFLAMCYEHIFMSYTFSPKWLRIASKYSTECMYLSSFEQCLTIGHIVFTFSLAASQIAQQWTLLHVTKFLDNTIINFYLEISRSRIAEWKIHPHLITALSSIVKPSGASGNAHTPVLLRGVLAPGHLHSRLLSLSLFHLQQLCWQKWYLVTVANCISLVPCKDDIFHMSYWLSIIIFGGTHHYVLWTSY